MRSPGHDRRALTRLYDHVMTREEALAEVERRRVSDPDATWLATERGGQWIVARLGLTPTKPTGTATKPPPDPPLADPQSPIVRATWFAGTGG
jgi:hypothetical protein